MSVKGNDNNKLNLLIYIFRTESVRLRYTLKVDGKLVDSDTINETAVAKVSAAIVSKGYTVRNVTEEMVTIKVSQNNSC